MSREVPKPSKTSGGLSGWGGQDPVRYPVAIYPGEWFELEEEVEERVFVDDTPPNVGHYEMRPTIVRRRFRFPLPAEPEAATEPGGRAVGVSRTCPVEGCDWWGKTAVPSVFPPEELMDNFLAMHVRDVHGTEPEES